MADIDDFLSVVDQVPQAVAPVSAPDSDLDSFLAVVDAETPPAAVLPVAETAPIAEITLDNPKNSPELPGIPEEDPLDFDPSPNIGGAAEGFLSVMNEFAAAGPGSIAAAMDTFFDGDIKKFPENLQKRIEQGTLIHPQSDAGKRIKGEFQGIFESFNLTMDEFTEVLIDPAKHPGVATAINTALKALPFGAGLFGRGKAGEVAKDKPIAPEEAASPKAEKAGKLFETSKLNAEAGNSAEAVNAFSKATEIVDNAKELGLSRKEATQLRKEAINLKRRLDTFKDVPGPQQKGLHRIADQLLEKIKEVINPKAKPVELVEVKGKLKGRPDINIKPRTPEEVVVEDAHLKPTKAPPEQRARALDADIKARVKDINERIAKNEPIGEELDSLATVKKMQDALRKKPTEEVQSDLLRHEPAAIEPIKRDSAEEVKARSEQVTRGPTKEGQKELPNLDVKKIEQVIPEAPETPVKVEAQPRDIKQILGKRVDQIRQSTPEDLAKFKPVVRGETVEFPDFLGRDVEGSPTTKGAVKGEILPKPPGITQGLRHKFPIEFLGEEIPLNQFTNEIVDLYDRLIDAKSSDTPKPNVIKHIEQEIIDREAAIARRSEEVLANQKKLDDIRQEQAKKADPNPNQLKIKETGDVPIKKRTRAEFLEDIKHIDTNKHSISEIAIRMGGVSSIDAAKFGFHKSEMAEVSRRLFGSSQGNVFKKTGIPLDELHLRLNEEHGTNFKDVGEMVEALQNDVSAVLSRDDTARVKILSRNTEAEIDEAAAEHFADTEKTDLEVSKEIGKSSGRVFKEVSAPGFPENLRTPSMKAFEVSSGLRQEGLPDISKPLEGAIADIAGKTAKPDTKASPDKPDAADKADNAEDFGMRGALKKSIETDPEGFEAKTRAYAKDIREGGDINPVSTFVRHFGEIKQPPAVGGKSPLDNQIGAIDPLLFIETFVKGGRALAEKMFGEKMPKADRDAFEKMDSYEGAKVHERGRKKVAEHFKKTMAERVEEIETAMLSRNRPLIRKILQEAGTEGWKTIMKMDLSKKASSRTMVEVAELRQDVFEGLNSMERNHLDRIIFEKSMVELGTLKPEVANPEGRLAEDILREHDAQRRDPVTRQKFKALERRADKFFKFMERQLSDMLDKGIISRELFNTLKNRKQYVRREFIDKVDPDNTSGLLRGTPGSVRDPGLRKLAEGGIKALREDAMLQALFYTTVKNNRIARNDALAAVGTHLQGNPDSSIGRMHKPGKEIPFGMEEFVFLVNGKKRSMVVNSRFAQQLTSSDPQMTATFTKFLSWMSGTPFVRATATAFNPAFALVNFPRDFFWQYFASLEHSPHLPIFFLQMANDLAATKKFLPSPREFKRDIFKGFARDMIEHGMLPHFLATEGTEEIMQIHPHLEGIVKYAEWFQYNAEMWNRLAVSHRAMNNAMEKYKASNGGQEPPRGSDAHDAILQYAAWHGRSVMDFDTGGRFTKPMNNFLPYFNPGVVALRTFMDRIFLKKAPAGTGSGGPGNPNTKNTKIPGTKLSVNDDFLTKTAWTFALGATAWYFANGDEKKREMYDQISDEEKMQYFIIPFPQADYLDENEEVRHAYIRIAKSHEARPFLTLIESIMDKQAGREFDIKRTVAAANNAIALFPEQSIGVPLYNATVALANFDTWTNKEIWSQLGGPVLPESEVKYDTNELLTSAAKTNVGRSLGISPARSQVAISKLLVPSNPGVMAMGEMMSGLAIAGGADMSQRNIKKDFPSMSRRFPFLERVFRYTQPVKQIDKKTFLSEQQKANSAKLEQNRMVRGHLQREKKGLQGREALDDAIRKIEDRDVRKRLQNKAKAERKSHRKSIANPVKGLAQFQMLAKPGVNPEAKAGQAFRMWRRKSPDDRVQFERDLKKHGGIWSDRFKKRFRHLTRNSEGPNIQ